MTVTPRGIDAPFPYFGGKKRIAHEVWAALGNVGNYVEPFFGSGAVLLQRPHKPGVETVNDADGMVSNFWRAIKSAPDDVAHHADNPVNECDLHARHLWLVNAKAGLTERLMADPDWFDAKAAGWWVWGASCWIGGGWCSGEGTWVAEDGVLVKRDAGQGVSRRLPHLGDAGRGVNRKLPNIGGTKTYAGRSNLTGWFAALSSRLAGVRVACGDWSRVIGPSVLRGYGACGVFLDPPYSQDIRADVYATESHSVAHDVREWCAENGGNPDYRIVLAGYDGEHNALEALGWRVMAWKASGGYGVQGDGRGRENAAKERLWLSPHCLDARAVDLLKLMEGGTNETDN